MMICIDCCCWNYVHEALKAYDLLIKEGIAVSIIDLYSIKPLDAKTIEQVATRSGIELSPLKIIILKVVLVKQ